MTREVVEDDGGETPEEGSTTSESESYDGDGDAHAQRREERFVDYYRVKRGRPTSEGQHMRRGVHMTSQDRSARKVAPSGRLLGGGGAVRAPAGAIGYDGHNSDSTSADHKPPR